MNWCDVILNSLNEVHFGSLKQLAKGNFPEQFTPAGEHLRTTTHGNYVIGNVRR